MTRRKAGAERRQGRFADVGNADVFPMEQQEIFYARCAFSARLDAGFLYTPGHAWIGRHEERVWRVGLTEFAIRVLGEPVEFEFDVRPGAKVQVGQVIGWIEGLKAITDLFCALSGCFQGVNPKLTDDIGLIDCDPCGQGWLYLVEGTPGDDCLKAKAYASLLDTTIDQMRSKEA